MTCRYFAFGLTIDSDVCLPELLPAADNSVEAVTIRQTPVELEATASAEQLTFEIPTIGRFLISSGKKIFYDLQESVAEATLRLFLLGSCLGALLLQRGNIVLHGNAISTDKKTCEIFVGDSGAGKSTLAASRYLQDDWVLADDVCVVQFNEQGQPFVLPSYPQLKLWQDSAELLGVDTAELKEVRPGQNKFALPIKDRFIAEPLPLKAINELTAEHEELKGLQKLPALTRNTYRYFFVEQMGLVKTYQAKLLQLAGSVSWQCKVRESVITNKV